MEQHVRTATDIVAVGTFAAALAGWLPTIAAAFSIAWIVMQMVINWSRFVEKLKEWLP